MYLYGYVNGWSSDKVKNGGEKSPLTDETKGWRSHPCCIYIMLAVMCVIWNLLFILLSSIWQRNWASTPCGSVICRPRWAWSSCWGAPCLEGEPPISVFVQHTYMNKCSDCVFWRVPAGLEIFSALVRLWAWPALPRWFSSCCSP